MTSFTIGFALCMLIIIKVIDSAVIDRNYEDASFWHAYGENHLKKVLKWSETNVSEAKNVIIFIGDGMGMTTITAGRIFKGQRNGKQGEEESLAWDPFPGLGLAKTYSVDKQVPDSASTATAIFSGIKTHSGVLGMDITTSSTNPKIGKISSLMGWAQNAGKRTGFVTSTRVTHATPAALYANVPERGWECDSKIPSESKKYTDIARQLVENSPGNKFNVILGGGKVVMGTNESEVREPGEIIFTGGAEEGCERSDNRNLIQEWINIDSKQRIYAKNSDELMAADVDHIDHLMGLFAHNHLSFSIVRPKREPTLQQMTAQALRVLKRPNSNGFVLMVEGGRIDHGHHQNHARAALHEVLAFDAAVQHALDVTSRKDTLIIVTSDHSHAMTLNGYPNRGNDILGIANPDASDPHYETMTYANGPGFAIHRANKSYENTVSDRTWIPIENFSATRENPLYRHRATFPVDDETHAGEDVPVYAVGPGSNLIRGVFEQSYIAYAVSYATCLGPAVSLNKKCYEKYVDQSRPLPVVNTTGGSNNLILNYSLVTTIIILNILLIF